MTGVRERHKSGLQLSRDLLMKWSTFATLIFSFLSLFSVEAKSFGQEEIIQKYFDILKNESTDFEPTGAVCERVAVRELVNDYPADKFFIKNGIQYDERNMTIGELDVVIFDKATGLVEAVAEVKCWRSFEGARKKAKEQRMRFQTYLNKNIVIYDDEGKKYPKNQFALVRRYFSISQQGGVGQGFDFELTLDFKEMMELRKRLLDCRAFKNCL